jgi:hypothetical protein
VTGAGQKEKGELTGDTKKNVIIYPFRDGANALHSTDVQCCIANPAIDPSVVAYTNSKLIVTQQLDDQAWPLASDNENGAVCFCHVTNGSLRLQRKIVDNKTDSGKGPPGAEEIVHVNGIVN